MSSSRLSSLDASFFRVETEAAHMHVAWKGRFRPRDDGTDRGGPAVTVEALRASVAARLRHAPRFRQRVAFPPAGLGEAVWVDDGRFDVAAHVVPLGPPGAVLDRARFDALCDEELSTPLDRARALWSIALAERLEDGGCGLLMKIHHAMVDGRSAVELALLLLDLQPDADHGKPDAWAPSPAPGPGRMAVDALADQGRETLRAARGLARGAAGGPVRSSARLADTLRRTALAVGEDMLRAAPASYVNREIGPRRALVQHTTDVEPLLECRRRHGVTLNDVVLCVVSGALRDLSMAVGRVPGPLKVMVPVSMRDPGGTADGGNRIAFVFVDLPVELHRPGARLRRIHEQTARLKREGRAGGGETLLGALGVLPDPLRTRAARLAASPRTYNLVVSNVPGPRFPVYLLGCPIEEAVPVIPITEGHALSVGIFTYGTKLTFSVYLDPEALPQARDLPDGLATAVGELVALDAADGGPVTSRAA